MLYAPFDPVVLVTDFPEEGLRAGTRGTVVDAYEKPREGYLVEFFDNNGNTIDVFVAHPDQLKLDLERTQK